MKLKWVEEGDTIVWLVLVRWSWWRWKWEEIPGIARIPIARRVANSMFMRNEIIV